MRRLLKTIALVFVAAASALGGLAQFLDWLGIKSKDVRMIASMGWPHWVVLASGLLLFASSLGISFYALCINLYRVKGLEGSHADEIASLEQSHADEIRRINTSHESEELRSAQIRDEALAESRAAHAELEAATSRIAKLLEQIAALGQHISAPPDDLPVTLRPTKGPSPEQFLIVTNNGERQGFRGRCTVFEGSSPENATNSFGLKWESGDAEVYLARGESRKLLIARAWQDRPYQLEYICLCTDAAPANDEVLMERWNIGEKPTATYQLEISIFGRKTQTFHKQQFTVRPGKKSAIEMYEI